MQAGLISAEDIIIDAKSGVSGAGRSAKQNLLYTEIAEGINCYGVGSHRHMPEIEQARPWVFIFSRKMAAMPTSPSHMCAALAMSPQHGTCQAL